MPPWGLLCGYTQKKHLRPSSVYNKRHFHACPRAPVTLILGARGQAVISDFQKRSGRSAKNSSTRTIEKIAFFAKKCKKVQGLYLKVKLKISLNWLHLDSVISEKMQKVESFDLSNSHDLTLSCVFEPPRGPPSLRV